MLRDIGRDNEGAPSQRLDLGASVRQAGSSARDQTDPGPSLCKFPCGCPPHTGGRAGNHHYFRLSGHTELACNLRADLTEGFDGPEAERLFRCVIVYQRAPMGFQQIAARNDAN